MLSLVWNQDLFSVIIDERNEVLAQAIIQSEENNIFVIYGLMHFEWVFNLLKASDSKWEITSTKEYTIITDPGE
jgi:pheromone shutdown protein TraB